MKKTAAIILLLVVCTVALTGCGLTYEETVMQKLLDATEWAEYNEEWTPVKNQAVIILHGLMDGALYEASTEEGKSTKGVWAGGLSVLSGIGKVLNSDEECFPTYKVRVGNMTDSAPYSANGMMNDIYYYFNENYSDEYDVLCWQYDWRQHLDSSARQLNRFITDSNYDSVILIGHSMGTCVISRYLAMGEAQRSKVKLFIPFGGPMLGSVDAGDFLLEKDGKMDNTGLMSQITDMVSLLGIKIESLTRNFATAYHLMVSDAFNATPHFTDGQTAYMLGDSYITAKQFHSYLGGQEWAITENGTVKIILQTLNDFQDENFVDGKHVSTLVPTEYVLGTGVDTVMSITIDNESGKVISRRSDALGDGLVPAYSASVGLPLDSNNVHVMSGCNHMDIVLKSNGLYGVLDTITARLAEGTAGGG